MPPRLQEQHIGLVCRCRCICCTWTAAMQRSPSSLAQALSLDPPNTGKAAARGQPYELQLFDGHGAPVATAVVHVRLTIQGTYAARQRVLVPIKHVAKATSQSANALDSQSSPHASEAPTAQGAGQLEVKLPTHDLHYHYHLSGCAVHGLGHSGAANQLPSSSNHHAGVHLPSPQPFTTHAPHAAEVRPKPPGPEQQEVSANGRTRRAADGKSQPASATTQTEQPAPARYWPTKYAKPNDIAASAAPGPVCLDMADTADIQAALRVLQNCARCRPIPAGLCRKRRLAERRNTAGKRLPSGKRAAATAKPTRLTSDSLNAFITVAWQILGAMSLPMSTQGAPSPSAQPSAQQLAAFAATAAAVTAAPEACRTRHASAATIRRHAGGRANRNSGPLEAIAMPHKPSGMLRTLETRARAHDGDNTADRHTCGAEHTNAAQAAPPPYDVPAQHTLAHAALNATADDPNTAEDPAAARVEEWLSVSCTAPAVLEQVRAATGASDTAAVHTGREGDSGASDTHLAIESESIVGVAEHTQQADGEGSSCGKLAGVPVLATRPQRANPCTPSHSVATVHPLNAAQVAPSGAPLALQAGAVAKAAVSWADNAFAAAQLALECSKPNSHQHSRCVLNSPLTRTPARQAFESFCTVLLKYVMH